MSNFMMEMVRDVNQAKEFDYNFRNAKISHETLKEILDAGRRAPSYKNEQNWRFILVRDDTKDELYRRLEVYRMNYVKDINSYNMKRLEESIKYIKDCNLFIIVTMEINEFVNTSPKFSEIVSIGACIENMTLMATERVLDVAWIYADDIMPVVPVMEECLIDCCRLKLNNKRNTIIAGLCLGKEKEGVVKEQVPLKSIDLLTYKNDNILPVINLSDF